jgi:ribonuclease R
VLASLAASGGGGARRHRTPEDDIHGRHIGDEFKGQVTGVTSFGLFVELARNHVNGLVHITSLPNDYYHFDPVVHRLTGNRTGKVYQLAQKVTVRVLAVNVDDRKIDFELVT